MPYKLNDDSGNYNSNDYYQNTPQNSNVNQNTTNNQGVDNSYYNGAYSNTPNYNNSGYVNNSGYSDPNAMNGYNNNPYGYGNPIDNARSYSQAPAVTNLSDVLVKSFLFMFAALMLTGIVSIIAANANFIFEVGTPGIIVCFVLEFVLVIAAQSAMNKNNVTLSAVLFGAYCIVNALTLSVVFYVYASSSIAEVFIITAILFAVMAAIGYFTTFDLTSVGNLLLIGLFGIIFGSIVNMFLHSSGLDYFLTIAGIIVFIGLTAYDVQKIKRMAAANCSFNPVVLGLYGAMTLYLDFINLFLRLLRILGRSRN